MAETLSENFVSEVVPSWPSFDPLLPVLALHRIFKLLFCIVMMDTGSVLILLEMETWFFSRESERTGKSLKKKIHSLLLLQFLERQTGITDTQL